MNQVGPKLIGKGKTRTFRCIWALEELGIPYQHIPAEPQSEQVKEHNPLGKIPVLVEDDGFSIFETNAIITYVGDKVRSGGYSSSNTTLVPACGTKERGLYDQTMSVLATELDTQALWIHQKHKLMADKFGLIPDAVEHARTYFDKTNLMLLQQLKDKRTEAGISDDDERPSYILGQNFTAADIVYVHCLFWSKLIGWDATWKDEVVVTNYLNSCKSRDAFSRAFAKREATL